MGVHIERNQQYKANISPSVLRENMVKEETKNKWALNSSFEESILVEVAGDV